LATLSNCGDTIKSFGYQVIEETINDGLVNNQGYGNNVKDVTIGNPQPSPINNNNMDAVHRLNVSGQAQNNACLRYSRCFSES